MHFNLVLERVSSLHHPLFDLAGRGLVQKMCETMFFETVWKFIALTQWFQKTSQWFQNEPTRFFEVRLECSLSADVIELLWTQLSKDAWEQQRMNRDGWAGSLNLTVIFACASF